jgi:hypothetical protein
MRPIGHLSGWLFANLWWMVALLGVAVVLAFFFSQHGLADYMQYPSVFAFVREWAGPDGRPDTVLCVNNLSRSAQAAELDLRSYEGVQPVEVLGGAHFPPVGELPYLLTLAGHGFYWFRLDPHRPASP